ncbi:RlpA-like double-psi beta-barrel-protein domain-containing protein-containing protein, partial [Rhodocollybia butyracea]
MYAISIVTVAVALLSSVATGFVVAPRDTPSTYATGYLEDYSQYHTRYIALGCSHKHHSNFFKTCCHPMLANETLAEARPSYCVPSSAASASALLVEPTSTVTTPVDPDDDGENHCNAKPATSSSAPTSSDAASVSPTPSPSDSSTEAAPTTSSFVPVNVAPSPSVSSSHKKTASSTEEAPTPTSSAAQAAPTGDSSSQSFTGGVGTFFYQNGVAGACGNVNPDSALIVALQTTRYDNGANCGKTVSITAQGKTIQATVADECPTCDNENCLDMSLGLFQEFESDLNVGQFDITWSFA